MVVFNKKVFFFLAAYFLFFPFKNMLFSWHFFLKNHTTIDSPEIKVNDLGNIYSPDMASSEKNELLNEALKYYPVKNQKLSRDDVKDILNQKGLFPETIRGNDISIRIPVKKIVPEEFSYNILKTNRLLDKNEYQVFLNNDIIIPAYLSFEIQADFSIQPGKKIARLKFADPNYQDVPVEYELRKKSAVYVSSIDLESGSRIKKEAIIQKIIYSAEPEIFNSKINPTGYMVTRDLKSGSIILPVILKKVIDVRPGDILKLTYSTKNISITYEGKANQSGSIGQVIKFRTAKNKYLYGEIVSSQLAIIADPTN
jgi:flagella basal body P-ring formation protein FlgA